MVRAKASAAGPMVRRPSTATRPSTCRCGAAVLALLFDAFDINLDSEPLTQLGECDALINRRRTFAVYGPMTYRRSAHYIAESPVPLGATVHREHVCGSTVPAAFVRPAMVRGTDPGF